jgi:hypothetical protein
MKTHLENGIGADVFLALPSIASSSTFSTGGVLGSSKRAWCDIVLGICMCARDVLCIDVMDV